MTVAPCVEGGPQEQVPDPWSRYGWLVAGIWLVFLVFPVIAVVEQTADRPALRAFLLGLLVVFAVDYIAVFVRGQHALHTGWTTAHRGWVFGGFAVLLAIPAIEASVLGVGVLGLTPFLASVAAFAFPWRAATWAVGGVVAFAMAIVVISGDLAELWFLLLLPGLIGAFGLLIRSLIDSDERRQVMQRTLAVADERDRVARDVHDVLGHSLTVIALKADLAERLVDRDPQRAKGEIADISDLTRQSLAEIRATVAGLRITRLAGERDAAAAALHDAGIDARLPEDGTVVDPAHRITMAWALREAVTNVIRHSGAGTVDIAWGPTWLEVVDDGRGRRGRRDGSGLTGLRERVTASGGRIEVTDRTPGGPGPGTRLRVELP